MTRNLYVGHAPEPVRAAFIEATHDPIEISSAVDIGDPFEPIEELCHELLSCTDTMPADFCATWDLPAGSHFSAGAAAVLKRIRG